MKYQFSPEQAERLDRLRLDFDYRDDLSDEQAEVMEDAVVSHFQRHGIEGDRVNAEGRMCESILDTMRSQET